MLSINKTYKVINSLDKVFSVIMRSFIMSVLVILSNAPLLLFIITYNGPLDIVSGAIIVLLSITIFPAYASGLYAIRKGKVFRNYFKFYISNIKKNYLVSLIFTLLLLVSFVDALFFKKLGLQSMYYVFLGLSLFIGLLLLNSGLLVSSFSMSLKNLLLMNIAYLKALSASSSAFILVMLIPYRLDILIYLLVIGMAMIAQVYVYRYKLETILEKITNEDIKYL